MTQLLASTSGMFRLCLPDGISRGFHRVVGEPGPVLETSARLQGSSLARTEAAHMVLIYCDIFWGRGELSCEWRGLKYGT